jgi:hypothetical protein
LVSTHRHRLLSWPAAAALSLVAAWASPARAGDTPAVLVLPFASVRATATRQNGERIAEMVRTELKANDSVTLVTSPDEPAPKASKKAPPPPPRSSFAVTKNERALAEARNSLAEAKDLSKHLKFKPALDAYQAAIQNFEANAAYADFGELSDAYLSLAVDQFRAGKEREVEHTLASVIRLDPDHSLDENYPPVFQRIFQATKKRLLAQPKGGVRAESTPPGATAIVDGREIGPTPVLIKDLVPGTHFIKLISGGIPVFATKIDVPSADVAHVSAQVRGGGTNEPEPEAAPLPTGPVGSIVAALSNNTIDEAMLKQAADAAARASADFVVLGGVLKKENTLTATGHLFDVKHRHLCQVMRVSFDAELLGAQLEIYKLANDIAGKVSGCDAETIPAKVFRDAPTAETAAVVAEVPIRSAAADTTKRSGGRRPLGAGNASPSEGSDSSESAKPPPPTSSGTASRSGNEAGKSRVVARAETKPPDTEQSDVPRLKTTEDTGTDESEGGVRRLEARTSLGEIQQSRDTVVPVDEQKQGFSPGKVALVTVIALVVAGALAGGTVLIVTQASQPASGTATIKW